MLLHAELDFEQPLEFKFVSHRSPMYPGIFVSVRHEYAKAPPALTVRVCSDQVPGSPLKEARTTPSTRPRREPGLAKKVRLPTRTMLAIQTGSMS